MIWTLAVVLFILWLLGFTVFHLGAIVHLLLVLAVIVILWRVITGQRPVV
ncbi:MAG: lmo0937 family membrane protein [Gemmatimonadota bacterium]|nr:lmo0937 family membrane protein [Gemmatimonadota bacterium]